MKNRIDYLRVIQLPKRFKLNICLIVCISIFTISAFAGTSSVIIGGGTPNVTFLTGEYFDISIFNEELQNKILSYSNVIIFHRQAELDQDKLAYRVAMSNTPFYLKHFTGVYNSRGYYIYSEETFTLTLIDIESCVVDLDTNSYNYLNFGVDIFMHATIYLCL